MTIEGGQNAQDTRRLLPQARELLGAMSGDEANDVLAEFMNRFGMSRQKAALLVSRVFDPDLDSFSDEDVERAIEASMAQALADIEAGRGGTVEELIAALQARA